MQGSLQLQMKAGEFTLTSDKMILSIISNFRVYYNLNILFMLAEYFHEWCQVLLLKMTMKVNELTIKWDHNFITLKKNPTDYATCIITA